MAELHVQRKENTLWPWILAAVALLALLFWFLWRGDDGVDVAAVDTTDSTLVDRAPNTAPMGSAAGTLAGSAVEDYLMFVDARASRAAGLAHEYTADGLRQLAAAMNEVAGDDSVGGVALRPRIEAIRERADNMQRNPNSLEHALQAREAFIMASSLMLQMNSNRGNAAGNLNALQDASTAIEASRPLLDQADQIEQFFEQAGKALQNMSGATQ